MVFTGNSSANYHFQAFVIALMFFPSFAGISIYVWIPFTVVTDIIKISILIIIGIGSSVKLKFVISNPNVCITISSCTRVAFNSNSRSAINMNTDNDVNHYSSAGILALMLVYILDYY